MYILGTLSTIEHTQISIIQWDYNDNRSVTLCICHKMWADLSRGDFSIAFNMNWAFLVARVQITYPTMTFKVTAQSLMPQKWKTLYRQLFAFHSLWMYVTLFNSFSSRRSCGRTFIVWLKVSLLLLCRGRRYMSFSLISYFCLPFASCLVSWIWIVKKFVS